MNTPVLKFWWEWGAATPFWPDDDVARGKFGTGEISAADLGLPPSLIVELKAAARWHDTSLNWAYPPDPGPWRQQECDRFNTAATTTLDRLRTELGADWDVIRNFPDQYEDPDIDRYLTDPAGFQRRPSPPPTATTTP